MGWRMFIKCLLLCRMQARFITQNIIYIELKKCPRNDKNLSPAEGMRWPENMHKKKAKISSFLVRNDLDFCVNRDYNTRNLSEMHNEEFI